MLVFLSTVLSAFNFWFLFKKMSERPFEKNIEEFNRTTESIMVEFNRVAARNIEMLDYRLEELDKKIRLSQKTEARLETLLEEIAKSKVLSQKIKKSAEKAKTPPQDDIIQILPPLTKSAGSTPDDNKAKTKKPAKSKEKEKNKDKKDKKEEGLLFRQDILSEHIKKGLSKDELLDMGFASSEINLAALFDKEEELKSEEQPENK